VKLVVGLHITKYDEKDYKHLKLLVVTDEALPYSSNWYAKYMNMD
jgi:hypothetical protein